MPPLFPIRSKILSPPTHKRLSKLKCLELRKEIQECARRNMKMKVVWDQFMYEVCDRISKYTKTDGKDVSDRFTPTDISLIFTSFAMVRNKSRQFLDFLLESVRMDLKRYEIRDITVLYNSLSKLCIKNPFIFDHLNAVIENKLTNKISEKDLSLLLNAILELNLSNVDAIFIKSAIILSSRIRFINNCHTLTLLLHSYSRLSKKVNPHNSTNINTSIHNRSSTEDPADNSPPDVTSTSFHPAVSSSTEVQSTSVPLASTVGLADSSSNYLSLKSNATPGDRGEGRGSKDVTSSGLPVADLREAEGEVNREGCLQDKDRTSSAEATTASGTVEVTSGVMASGEIVHRTSIIDDGKTSLHRDILISSLIISLLGRCMELLLTMRPTDLLFMYRSCINLIFNLMDLKESQAYGKIIILYKLHNQIIGKLLEFESRELIILLNVFDYSLSRVNDLPSSLASLEVVKLEILNHVPNLIELVKNELFFRSNKLSLSDSLNFLNLLPFDDHRVELIYLRLIDKLDRDITWDTYTNRDLFVVITHMFKRCRMFNSRYSSKLLTVLLKKSKGILKLRELDMICQLALLIGSKSNILYKKLQNLPCRADNLNNIQIKSLIISLCGLGYINIIESLLPYSHRLTECTVELLTALAILHFNKLYNVDDIFRCLKEVTDFKTHSIHYLSFLKACKLIEPSFNVPKFRIGAPLFGSKAFTFTSGAEYDAKKKVIKMTTEFKCYNEHVNEFINDFVAFVEKFDPKLDIKFNVEREDVILPIAVIIDDIYTAIIPLVDDFYSGSRQMLRLDKYVQLKILESLNIRYICTNLIQYHYTDKSQFMANLLKTCYNLPQNVQPVPEKKHETFITPQAKLSNSFTRFKQMLVTSV